MVTVDSLTAELEEARRTWPRRPVQGAATAVVGRHPRQGQAPRPDYRQAGDARDRDRHHQGAAGRCRRGRACRRRAEDLRPQPPDRLRGLPVAGVQGRPPPPADRPPPGSRRAGGHHPAHDLHAAAGRQVHARERVLPGLVSRPQPEPLPDRRHLRPGAGRRLRTEGPQPDRRPGVLTHIPRRRPPGRQQERQAVPRLAGAHRRLVPRAERGLLRHRHRRPHVRPRESHSADR